MDGPSRWLAEADGQDVTNYPRQKIPSPGARPTGEGEMGADRAGRTSDFSSRGPSTWQKRSKGRDPAWLASVQAQPHFFRPIAISVVGGVYST
jgi:hypothetical protein